jgi:CheY-like chemotaxis protein
LEFTVSIKTTTTLNKLLFIDGDDLHQMYTSLIFKKLGVEVDYIVKSTNALEAYLKGDYSMIVIDLDKFQKDGYELSMQFRELDAQIPIIGITDMAEIGIKFRAIEHGMNYCLGRTDLLEILNTCFAESGDKHAA